MDMGRTCFELSIRIEGLNRPTPCPWVDVPPWQVRFGQIFKKNNATFFFCEDWWKVLPGRNSTRVNPLVSMLDTLRVGRMIRRTLTQSAPNGDWTPNLFGWKVESFSLALDTLGYEGSIIGWYNYYWIRSRTIIMSPRLDRKWVNNVRFSTKICTWLLLYVIF